MAEDEDPVEDDVDQVGRDDGDDDGADPVHGLEGLAQHHEREERQDPGRRRVHVPRGQGDHVGRLPQRHDHRLDQQERDQGQHRDGQGQQQPPLDPAGNGGSVPGPHGLGDDGVQGEQDAHPEDRDEEEVEVAQRHGRQRRRADASDHERVHHAHEHEPDLDRHDGQREADQRAELVAGGQCEDRHEPGIVA